MTRISLLLAAIAAALALLITGPAAARGNPEPAAEGHGAAAEGHGAAAEGHGAAAEGHGAQGKGHGAAEGPGEINWFYGLLIESEGAEPSLLVRPKGMQPPLAALLLNTAILVWVVVRFGRRPMLEALKKRRATIMQGMDDAARMREEAEDRLAEYQDKLEHIDEEVERIKREMREAGEAERARILAEAKERRARMERDAQQLIEQELKAARQELMREAVAAAMKSATERLEKTLTAADHQRLADEYLAALDKATINAKGGRA